MKVIDSQTVASRAKDHLKNDVQNLIGLKSFFFQIWASSFGLEAVAQKLGYNALIKNKR